jgi:orotate phosphoribosyltransferase
MKNIFNSKDWKRLRELVIKLSYEKRDVILASGKPSNFYIDVKQTALNSEGSYLIGNLVYTLVTEEFPNLPDGIGGITMGADPIASAVSVISFMKGRPIPAFYIRKEPKAHGTGRWVEGIKNLKEGAQVVIVEDVVTTGGSTIKACKHAEETGYKVMGIISIVDREEGGRENIEKEGYWFESLFVKSDICS